jgi:hypothetical protein
MTAVQSGSASLGEAEVVVDPPSPPKAVQPFSPALLEYVHQHLLLPGDSNYERFRDKATYWMAPGAFARIPGNVLVKHKLERVSEWLAREPLDLYNEQGARIGLPIIAVGCTTGSFKLVEGNHRVYVLIHERGVTRVPVQISVVEDSWETPVCAQNCMDTEEDVDDLHNKLLDILFDAGFEHCGLWLHKEVWRAALWEVISIRLAESTNKRLKI